jgi:SAM-dependent methyltransferase
VSNDRVHAIEGTDHIARNRAFWDADSDAYQELHGEELATMPLAWGAWRRPEDELQVLGEVEGKRMLELGCGAAQWSAALTQLRAECIGLDLSVAQLRNAQRHCTRVGVTVPLVLASAECVPFAAGTFDVVFCDHGAMSFADPERTVPEAARLLVRGGLFAFCATHPLVYLTWNEANDRQTRRLQIGYDELGRIDAGDGTSDWIRPPGVWIHLLRSHGFEVEDLIELSPPDGATTTYDQFVPYKWARRWPAEEIWRARKR